MAISFGDNLSYVGKKSDFARQEYATIADMKAVRKTQMPEMYIAYCLEDRKVYLYNKANDNDDTLGYWREFGAGGGSSESIQKTVMPEASETEFGKVYQYIGTTTDNFTRGYFYLCTSEEEEQTVEITTVEQLAGYINNSDLKVEVNTGSETEQLTAFVVTLTREVMMPEPPNIVEISHNYCYIYNDTVYMIDNEGTSGNVSNDTAITSENINLYMFSTEDMVTVYSWINIPTTEVPKSIQVVALPEASDSELGNIYQFVGNSTEYTINGYFYQCAVTGSVIETHVPQTVEDLKYDIEHYPTGTIQVNTGSTTEELDCLANCYVYDDTIYLASGETGNISTDTPLISDELVASQQFEYDVDAPVYGWEQIDVQPGGSGGDYIPEYNPLTAVIFNAYDYCHGRISDAQALETMQSSYWVKYNGDGGRGMQVFLPQDLGGDRAASATVVIENAPQWGTSMCHLHTQWDNKNWVGDFGYSDNTFNTTIYWNEVREEGIPDDAVRSGSSIPQNPADGATFIYTGDSTLEYEHGATYLYHAAVIEDVQFQAWNHNDGTEQDPHYIWMYTRGERAQVNDSLYMATDGVQAQSVDELSILEGYKVSAVDVYNSFITIVNIEDESDTITLDRDYQSNVHGDMVIHPDFWEEIGGSSVSEASDVLYENLDHPSLSNVGVALDNILAKIYYVEPKINSFTMSPGTTEYEIGASVSNLVFNWTTNKEITTQTLTDCTLADETVRTATAAGPYTSNKTFTLSIGDGENTATSSKSISFKHKVYWGSAAEPNGAYDSTFILDLSNKKFATNYKGTYSMTVAQDEYGYLAYPSSWGTVTDWWISGFSVDVYDCGTIDFTNASGNTTTFRVIRTTQPSLGAISPEIK